MTNKILAAALKRLCRSMALDELQTDDQGLQYRYRRKDDRLEITPKFDETLKTGYNRGEE